MIQAEWERSRKELDKARHDVERLRRALDRSDVEKRDQQHKATAVNQALQVERQQNNTKQNKTKQNRTEQNKTKQNKTEQNRTEQNKTKQN